MKDIIVIVGPTGVGKTKLSIELAKKLDAEIINGDSVAVYKNLDKKNSINPFTIGIEDDITNRSLSKEEIKKGVYRYAMYVGKGANGKRRFKNHISSRIRTSTLRRTIAALLETNNEDAITTVLKNCYYEWWEIECDKKTLAEEEKNKINEGYYPLNLKENNKVCTKWKKILQEQRKKV